MADVIPFHNYRPVSELAAEYAALPYDVFTRAEAAAEIAAHPLSFLRIDKTTALMPTSVDEYDSRVYTRARELLLADEQTNVLIPEPDGKAHYYLYRLTSGQHTQIGIVACVSTDDYNNNVIKRHENTRVHKRHDRVEHIAKLGAHTGPVLMAYRPHERINAAIAYLVASSTPSSTLSSAPSFASFLTSFLAPSSRFFRKLFSASNSGSFSSSSSKPNFGSSPRSSSKPSLGSSPRSSSRSSSRSNAGAHAGANAGAHAGASAGSNAGSNAGAPAKLLYDFQTADGISHCIWRIDDEEIEATIRQAFLEVETMYIADGHHRAAAAAIIAEKQGGQSAYFLSVLFSAEQLEILDYNRVVFDLYGHTLEEFLKLVGGKFELYAVPHEQTPYRPRQRGEIGMYVQGTWYRLVIPEKTRPTEPVAQLDVSILQERLLDPILGIDDPRSSTRIAYVGGVRGLEELERRAKATGGVVFSLYPCSLDELFTVADAGELMPPKSTWFEPKPRSGLFIHKI